MSTTIAYHQPLYNRHSRNEGTNMKQPDRATNLQVIIEKVRELQQLTARTGFRTTRSVGELLANLTPDELVEVNKALRG
jgi:hypothetical protein